MKGLSVIIMSLFIQTLAFSQSEYAVWTKPGAPDNGTGTFVNPSMPDFTWTVTATGTTGAVVVDNSENWLGTNGIETEFGEANTASNLNFRSSGDVAGNPIVNTATLTINFNSNTPASGWAMSFHDFEDDQGILSATDAAGNPVSTAVLDSWFQSVFDIDGGAQIPTYVNTGTPANTVAWYGHDLPAPVGSTYHVEHVTAANLAGEAGAIWFKPNISLQSITLQFQAPWDATVASMHAYVAFNEALLPVKLTSFDAHIRSTGVDLNWITESEVNNDYFSVERSLDGVDFQKIGKVAGIGNTRTSSDYTFMDREILSLGNNTAFYRLKQVDYNGAFEYSDVISVKISQDRTATQLFPNPISAEHRIFNVSGSNINAVQVINSSGMVLYRSSNLKNAENVQIPTNKLSPGLYFVVINNGESNLKLLFLE